MKSRAMMIIHNFRPGPIGGTELQAERLSRELAAMGHEMQVLTRIRMPDLPKEELSDGVRIHRLASHLPYWITHENSATFRFLVCKRNTYDILHAHQAFGHAVMAVVTARLLQKKSIIKIASSGFAGDLSVLSGFFGYTSALKILKKANAIVAISREVERELIEDYGFPSEIVHRIPNGVDVNYFRPVTAVADASGPARFVLLGRRHPHKGTDVALHAARILVERGYKERFEVHMYGSEYPEYDYRKMASEAKLDSTVFFNPFTEDTLPVYRQADALILPSRLEGLSNTLLEAMAVGLPVIASNVSGTPDVILSGKNGILIAPDNPDLLADVMAMFIEKPEALSSLGRAARKTVTSDFSLAAVTQAYSSLYEAL